MARSQGSCWLDSIHSQEALFCISLNNFLTFPNIVVHYLDDVVFLIGKAKSKWSEERILGEQKGIEGEQKGTKNRPSTCSGHLSSRDLQEFPRRQISLSLVPELHAASATG